MNDTGDTNVLMWAVGILLVALQAAWLFIIRGLSMQVKDIQKETAECYKRNDIQFVPRNEFIREHESVNTSLKEIKVLLQKVFDEVKLKEDRH